MKLKRLSVNILGSVVLALTASVVAAVTPIYQIDDAGGDYIQVPLLHDVYRYLPSGQLNHLAVIDNQGNKLPYRIETQAMTGEEDSEIVSVPFYPVAAGTPTENLRALGRTAVHINRTTLTVDMEPQSAPDIVNPATVDFYLLDISDVKQTIKNLIVDWQADAEHEYLEVQVSGTQDLQRWVALSKATLVQLQNADKRLTQNNIELNLGTEEYSYLRLALVRGGSQLKIHQIELETVPITVARALTDTWQIMGKPAETQTSVSTDERKRKLPVVAWEFVRQDTAPVTAIGIELAQHTYGDSIAIFSRATAKMDWQRVYDGAWFNVRIGTAWQQSELQKIRANAHPYWRLELRGSAAAPLAPELIFERSPPVVQFIANQAAPYQLAVDKQANNTSASAEILAQLLADTRPEWTTATLTPLNPDTRQFEKSEATGQWKLWLFWTSLLAAVAILVVFAARLIKQMD